MLRLTRIPFFLLLQGGEGDDGMGIRHGQWVEILACAVHIALTTMAQPNDYHDLPHTDTQHAILTAPDTNESHTDTNTDTDQYDSRCRSLSEC